LAYSGLWTRYTVYQKFVFVRPGFARNEVIKFQPCSRISDPGCTCLCGFSRLRAERWWTWRVWCWSTTTVPRRKRDG